MKKNCRLHSAFISLCLFTAVLLCACLDSPFMMDLIDGEKGNVIITIGSLEGRALKPVDMTTAKLSRIDLTFTGPGETKTGSIDNPAVNNTFTTTLAAGTWTVSAIGYTVLNGKDYAAARGSSSIEVSASGASCNITMETGIFKDITAPGVLAYNITISGTVTSASINMIPFDDYLSNPNATGNLINIAATANRTGTREYAPGFYWLTVTAANTSGTAVWNEIVNIYSGQETKAEHTFTTSEYTATARILGGISKLNHSIFYNFSVDPFGAAIPATMTANTTLGGVTFVASSTANMTSAAGTASIDGVSFTRRVQLSQAGSNTSRAIQFSVTGPSIIRVYGNRSATGTTTLALSSGTTVIDSKTFSNTAAYFDYIYTGAAGTLSVYTSGSTTTAFYVYGIKVFPKIGQVLTPVTSEITGLGADPTVAAIQSGFKYQWKADNDNIGSGSATYTIAGANAGKVISTVITHEAAEGSITATGEKVPYNVAVTRTGNTGTDALTVNPEFGFPGDTITLNYTVANTNGNNRLQFSGVAAGIETVNAAGTGTRTFTLAAADASSGIITINGTFSHVNLTANTIAFANTSNETRTYGDASYTKAITNAGNGNGAITYASGTATVATVNNTTGAVTILIPGTTVITATKASDGTYAEATASYTLTVNKKDVTITGLSASNKTYNGNATATITGTAAISGLVSGDSSYVSVAAGTASFNNKNVGNSKAVTFTGYSLSGTRADRYNLSAQPANVTANITAKQLTISNPVYSGPKVYNGSTDASSVIAIGTLSGVETGDTVTAALTSAVYNDANVANAATITIIYSLTGTDAGNYTKPVDGSVSGTITKANGSAINAVATVNTKTSTSITVNAATLTTATGQTIEYASSTTGTGTGPTSGWQDTTTLSGLSADTNYYVWARSKSSDNYNTGTARASAVIKTDSTTSSNAIPFTKIDFEADALDKTYEYTQGNNAPTVVVKADPANSAQKSLRITITQGNNQGWNQAAVIPVNLPYELQNYSKVTFRFRAASGTFTEKQVMLYAADAASRFVRYGFGNPASDSNQFAAYLVGTSADVATSTTAWSNYEIPITNPGTSIATLKGTVYLAIGIHNQTTLEYYLDDIDFILKSDFVPPIVNSSISPSTANFNKTVPTDRPVEVTLNGNTLVNIQRGTTTLASGTGTANITTGANAYSVSGNIYTIRKEYLALLADGTHTFTFNFNSGTAQTLTVTIYTAASGITYFKKIDFQSYSTGTPSDITSTAGNGTATMTIVQDSTNTSTRALQISTSNYNQAAIIPIQLDYPLHNYNKITIRVKPSSGTTALNGKSLQIYAAGSKSDFTSYGFGNEADATHSMVPRRIAKSATLNFGESPYFNTWTAFELDNIAHTTNDTWAGNLKGPAFIAVGLNVSNSAATIIIDDIDFQLKPDFVPPPPPPAWTQPPSVGAVSSGTYRNIFLERGLWSASDITAKVNKTWNRLFEDNETVEVEVGGQKKTTEKYRIYYEVASTTEMGGTGAYILDYNGQNDKSDVRSEGQSYGMMMAVQMNDQAKFDRLWRWAKAYMYNATNVGKNSRGYFAWQVNPTAPYTKIDVGPAPDGEFYFVTALLFAHARWGSGTGVMNYRQHAMQLIYDMIHRDTAKGDNHGEPSMIRTTAPGLYMPVFQPQGNAGTFTDPSYHLPSFYEVWVHEMKLDADAGNLHGVWSSVADMRTDITFYENVVTTSRNFFDKAIHPTSGLNGDYTTFEGVPTGNQNYFGYDAFRTIKNIAMDYAWWAKDAKQKTYADRLQTFFHAQGVNTYKALYEWDGTPRSNPGDHSPGLVACNAVASLAATNARAWDFIEDFWEVEMTPGRYRYYDGCLYMFGMLHLSGNFKVYLSNSTPGVPNSSIDKTTAEFDKRTSQQKDIDIVITLNGNTFTNIQRAGNTLTAGTGTVSGNTNAYTITTGTATRTLSLRKEYLATLANGSHTFTFNFSQGTSRTLTVTISQSTATNSAISPATATFSKSAAANIEVTMTLNGNTLSNIQRVSGTNLTSGTGTATAAGANAYTISGNTITIRQQYLTLLDNGSHTLTFNFSEGAAQTLALTVQQAAPAQNSTITPTTASFSKASPANVTVTMTLNGNSLSSIANGSTTLSTGTGTATTAGANAYTVSGNTITIRQQYLTLLSNATHTLTFTFSAGNTQSIAITVSAGSTGFQTPPTTGAITSGVYRNIFAEFGKSSSDITAKVNTAWNRLFKDSSESYRIFYDMNTPIGAGAYILDTGNNDIRSEGMSYGMMMAVQMDDKTTFDKLWRWARHYMYNTSAQGRNMRGYFTWAMNTSGSVKDLGIAPDGEFYFATALLFAHARWGSNTGTGQTVPGSGSGTDTSARDVLNYRYHAMLLLYDMIHRDIPSKDPYSCTGLFRRPGDAGNNIPAGYYQPVFSPYGNSQNHTDPSYHLPAFYDVWAYEMEKDADAGTLHGVWSSVSQMREDVTFYKTAATTSRDFFNVAMHSTTGLSPDYSEFDGTPTGGQKYFGYDAFRTVMNVAMDYAWWAKDSRQTGLANKLLTFFYGKGVTTYKGLWNVDGTAYSNPGDHSPGLVAMNAAASLVSTYANTGEFVDDFWNISMTSGQYRYYDGCLYMLGMLNVTGNFRAYLSGSVVPTPSISPTSATFDKRTSQQAAIVVTMNLAGSSLSNIKNGGTTLTSGTNYTTSGTGDTRTVTINTSYLNTLSVGSVTLVFTFADGTTRNLAINVIQSTVQSSTVAPASITFSKADAKAIPVIVTLNGNTLSEIRQGTSSGTLLTSGTQYTNEAGTAAGTRLITFSQSYLNGLSNASYTLTFRFSEGNDATVNLTVQATGSTTGGGGGTAFDFASASPTFTVSGTITAVVTGGVLVVTKSGNYSTPTYGLTFSLGSQTLGSFEHISVLVKKVSGDTDYKSFIARVGGTQVGTVSTGGLSTSTFTELKIPLASSLTQTGDVLITFEFNNTNAYEIQIQSITLKPR